MIKLRIRAIKIKDLDDMHAVQISQDGLLWWPIWRGVGRVSAIMEGLNWLRFYESNPPDNVECVIWNGTV